MELPTLILSGDRTRLGRDVRALSRKAQSGELKRIRQGVYVRAEEWEALASWDRYPLLILAAASTLKSETVFCRQSAAALWDWPVLGRGHPVHACTWDGAGGRSRAGVRRLSRNAGGSWSRAASGPPLTSRPLHHANRA